MLKHFGMYAQRVIAALLVITLLSPLLPDRAFAAYAAEPAQSYVFHTALESTGEDSERTMFFTEDYFSHPASDYSSSLASASLCMAMSAFGSNHVFKSDGKYDFTQANRNWLELFRDTLGFSDVRTNAYFTQPTRTDNVGVGMAWKLITVDDGSGNAETVPLIAVGVRGSNYMSEWGGNVNVGTSGDHAGFQQAANIVIGEVQDYIESIPALDGKDVKLWISGFSRAAATSNLFAGYLDEAIRDGTIEATISARLEKDDLYCYTFETPAGSSKPHAIAHGDDYSNIFNIINPNDLVPKVAPYFKDGAFLRYGTDCCLPSSITTVDSVEYEAVMKKIFSQLTGGNTNYIIDQFVGKCLKLNGSLDDGVNCPQSAAQFCSQFVYDLATDAVRTRADFVAKYQNALTAVMDFFAGSGERFGGKANQRRFLQFFPNGWNILWMFWRLIVHSVREYNKWPRESVKNTFVEILQEARKNSGVSLSNAYINDVADMATTLIWEIVGDNPLDNLREINYALTFFYASKNILQAHDPDVCLAWLMSMDRNYEPTTHKYQDCNEVLNSGEYRAVTVTGVMTVRVEQLSSTGKVVSTKEYTAEALGARQLRILLPTDASYRISISSPWKGSCDFNYMVTEYSPSVNGEKRVFYYKNPLETIWSSTVYTALIPAYGTGLGPLPDPIKYGIPEGSDLDYRLSYEGKPLTRVSVNKLLKDIRGKSGDGLADMRITSQPVNQMYAEGNNAVFEVAAQGETLNYQWYISKDNGDSWAALDGANDASYTVYDVKQSMVGNQYVCLVYDMTGDGSYSNAARLYMTPQTGDTASPLLWGLLLLIGLGGCCLLAPRLRRKREY